MPASTFHGNAPVNNDKTVNEIRALLKIWDKTSDRLVNLTVVFGILTIVTSVLVSVYTATGIIGDKILKIMACVSTASLTLMTAFNVVKKGNSSRKAWRILNAALFKYETGVFMIEHLINVYEVCESIVGDVDFSYGVASRSEESQVNRPHPAANTQDKNEAPPERTDITETSPSPIEPAKDKEGEEHE